MLESGAIFHLLLLLLLLFGYLNGQSKRRNPTTYGIVMSSSSPYSLRIARSAGALIEAACNFRRVAFRYPYRYRYCFLSFSRSLVLAFCSLGKPSVGLAESQLKPID